MRDDTIERILDLPCFRRYSKGLLDPLHKLLLLQLAFLSANGSCTVVTPDVSKEIRKQTSLTALSLAVSMRRLEDGRFVEISGAMTTDSFTVYFSSHFD